MIIPTLYIPSFYGDLKLERIDDKHTRLIVEKASPAEKAALEQLAVLGVKKKWVGTLSEVLTQERSIFQAPLLKVQKELVGFLKPGRQMVTAVRFTDGSMEEVQTDPDTSDSASLSSTPSGTTESKPEKPVKAATAVAKPTQGCPAPNFVKAELKARQVLEVFLDEDQIEDFRNYNRFVSIGADTGHRYMVTSRHARDSLADFQRSLYDLDDETPFCVHDWVVPAAEEMLALHVMLQLPEHEAYLRHLDH